MASIRGVKNDRLVTSTRKQDTFLATHLQPANLFLELVNVGWAVSGKEVLWYVCALSNVYMHGFTTTIGYDLTGGT